MVPPQEPVPGHRLLSISNTPLTFATKMGYGSLEIPILLSSYGSAVAPVMPANVVAAVKKPDSCRALSRSGLFRIVEPEG